MADNQKAVLDVTRHRDAVALGMSLEKTRDSVRANANTFLREMTPDSVRDIVDFLDTTAFAECVNERQLTAHDLCHVARQLIFAWQASLDNIAGISECLTDEEFSAPDNQALIKSAQTDADIAKTKLQAALAMLGQRAPRNVRGLDFTTNLAVTGYVTTLAALRSSEIAYCSMDEKRAAFRLAAEKRQAARQQSLDAVQSQLTLSAGDTHKLIAG